MFKAHKPNANQQDLIPPFKQHLSRCASQSVYFENNITLIYHGKVYYALKAFAHLTYKLDEKMMSLNIQADPKLFKTRHLNLPSLSVSLEKPKHLSAFMNYDILMQHVASSNAADGTLEGGIASRYGVLVANMLLNGLHNHPRGKRLTTRWTVDNPEHMTH